MDELLRELHVDDGGRASGLVLRTSRDRPPRMTTSRGIPGRAFEHKIPNAEGRRQVAALVASGQLSVPQAAERYGISAATAEFGGDR